MSYVFPLATPPALPVLGSRDLYPVRRIYCVGRNYAAHIREMGLDPSREPPFFFDKPADTLVQNGATIPYPPATEAFSHEIELVVAIGRTAVSVDERAALDAIFGYAVGLDMTRRDLQLAARDKGRPWDTGKGFDFSAPCTAIKTVAAGGHPKADAALWLKVNGQPKQQTTLAHMIWNVPEIVAHLSRLYRLEPGDLIFTGTPEGVGNVVPGDTLEGAVDGQETLKIVVGPRAQ